MTEDEIRSIDLEDIFLLHGHSSKQYLVKLTPTILSISLQNNYNGNQVTLNNNTRLIAIDDIYGCLCMKATKNPIQCHLNLYLYALRDAKGCFGRSANKGRARRSQQTLTYAKFDDFERNFAEVTRWHRYITYAIYCRRNLPADIVMAKQDKRALVFINPAGGSGRAYRLVMEYVVGVWSESEFKYHLIITEYAGHARDYVKTIQLADWSGIVVASGDGLLYEVINGLMSRNDWQEALKTPIGHIPCGSGNAFITNIVRYSKQPVMKAMKKFVVQAAVLVATHNVIPFDLAVVDICDGQRLFSFLCIEWAIIADVDCDSEKYRCIGEARFTVEAVRRILRPRVYNGYIDYIPHNAADNTVNLNQITSTAQLHHHLRPLNETISTDSNTTQWRRINGPFAHVLVTSKASIAKDFVASSESTLSDGYLTLQFIRSDGSTRMNLAKTFTKLSNGRHFDFDFVEWMPVRAFRIVPSDTNGNIMVDGEKVTYGPIQGEILPSIARCMGKQPHIDQLTTNI